jgi:PAS domain S-box-containing protein
MSRVLDQHESLRAIEPGALFDFIWMHAVEGMALVGTDREFLAVNPILCEWLGWTEGELRNMTFMDVTAHRDTKSDLEAMDEVIRGVRDGYTMNKTYTPKAGQNFEAKLTVIPWRTIEGRRVAFFFSQIERTETVHIQREDELRVLWNFLGSHKRVVLLVFCAVALAGDGFLEWVSAVFMAAGGVLNAITSMGG